MESPIAKESFGNLRIDKVRLSDAKAWLIKLQQIDGRGYSSIHSIRGVLRPAFQMAVDDDLLRKNPFEFELASVIVNDSVTREAITRKQQRDLLKFIQEDNDSAKTRCDSFRHRHISDTFVSFWFFNYILHLCSTL